MMQAHGAEQAVRSGQAGIAMDDERRSLRYRGQELEGGFRWAQAGQSQDCTPLLEAREGSVRVQLPAAVAGYARSSA